MSLTMFRLLDKKEDQNSYFVNEDGTKELDKKVNFNHRYGVLNPYYIVKEKGVREYRRYIRGCAFFDMERQDKEKYIFDINTGIVEFKAGGDIYVESDEDNALIEWLKDHPNNVDSVYHNKDKHDRQFTTHDPKKVVEEEVKQADQEDKAIALVIKLKDDEARLRAIGNVFQETSGMIDESQIYLELRRIAKETPALFLSSIANKQNAVFGDVRIARKYNIIAKDVKGFIYEDTKALIFETTEKDKVANEELTRFLMSRDGHDHYRQIQTKIAQAEIAFSAPDGSEEQEEE